MFRSVQVSGGAGVDHGVPGSGATIVLLPTYNERENLPLLVAEVLARCPAVDLLVIDDGSPDGTGEIADALAAAEPRINVLHRERKSGLGRAYLAGFRWALDRGYERVVQMDGDFSHRPEDLPRLLAAAGRSAVVVGSRYVPGGRVENWSWARRALSRFGSAYARAVLGGGPRDYTGGFRVLQAQALRRLDLDRIYSNGYAFQVEVNYACRRAGYQIAEVPITFPERRRGRSKMSMAIALEAAVLVLRLRLGLTPAALHEGPRTAPANR